MIEAHLQRKEERDEYARKRFSKRSGYTLIELLAVIFIVALATMAFEIIKKGHGTGGGIAAAAIAVVAGSGSVVLFYRWSWRRDRMRLDRMRTEYTGIYRVLAVPGDDQPATMLVGAEIKAGDYGWEAAPLVKDGLVYLQGLAPDWRTVWHAGFHPTQIERIAAKPSSQYDHWRPYWVKTQPAPCPFPILSRETPSMERPHHSGRYFQAYPQPRTGKMVSVKKVAGIIA